MDPQSEPSDQRVDQRTQRERMLAGDLYIADDPVLEQESQRAMLLMERFNSSSAENPGLRRELLEELFGTFGEESEIWRGIRDPASALLRLRPSDAHRGQDLRKLRAYGSGCSPDLDRRRCPVRSQRPAAHAHSPARCRSTATKVGGGGAHNDRRQRLDRGWGHSACWRERKGKRHRRSRRGSDQRCPPKYRSGR